MSTFLAAPTASALMADAGADVTRVEAPAGDPYRFYSLSYLSVNQRKRSIALDLRAPEGRRVLDDLITRADVLIDNLRPASLERLGIDDASLELLNPRLIRCSVSAFGQSSEMVQLPGFDPIMQALSGVAAAQGGDGEPVTIASPIFDILTGALTAFGALAAVLVRDRTGIAQKVSTSLAASTLVHAAELTFYAGRPPAARGGHDHPGPSPTHRYHRTADGWLAIAAKSDAEVDALLNVVGHPEWLGHPEEALSAELSSVFVTRQTAAWVDELGAASVPACPVLEREGALEDPILMANDFSHIVLDPDFGRIRLARSYADWVGGDAPPPARAQPLGHDTRAILSELGRSEAEIDELIEARIALSSG
jgi:crotonobetainyl-CoA:carnitine CoA-transferase CaiB-like acyl-CoA transferase